MSHEATNRAIEQPQRSQGPYSAFWVCGVVGGVFFVLCVGGGCGFMKLSKTAHGALKSI